MLQELAQYAESHGLAARAGFKEKALKGYICLAADGTFLDILPREKGAKPVYAPDIGSAANGTRYCNFLVEKAKIPLCIVENEKDKNIPTKFEFYLSMLEAGRESEPRFLAVRDALLDTDTRTVIAEALVKAKLKPGDAVGFQVDGFPLERSEAYLPWWAEFRTRFAPVAAGASARCLITGQLTAPMPTVPKVTGLLSVGGHTSGDAFLCFDKDAFQSYGLKKSANAPVSEEAMTAVNAALTDLLRKAPVFGGSKIVHWYSAEVPEELDLIEDLFGGDEIAEVATDGGEAERAALQESGLLLTALDRGKRPPMPLARYYILPLSGAGGRMMVRGWYEGSFETLCTNLTQWFQDLALTTPYGKGTTRTPKLKGVCTRLLKPGGDPKKVFERMDTELSNLSGRLFDAIIHGRPLPDEVASRALRYIRSGMVFGGDEEKKGPNMDMESMAFQLLKAWLVRRQRERGEITMGETVNEASGSAAYHCGRLMAVYGEIHKKAMPEVNVSVVERYYAAAINTPAFVLGKLSRMSVHHLAKLDQDNGGFAAFYRRHLEEIARCIDHNNLPGSLDLEEQTQFALGYYQQRAALHQKKD